MRRPGSAIRLWSSRSPQAAPGSSGMRRGARRRLGCGRSDADHMVAGRPAMLDGRPLIDAHQHPVRLSTVKPAWLDWAQQFGQPGWRQAYDADGAIIPQEFDDL